MHLNPSNLQSQGNFSQKIIFSQIIPNFCPNISNFNCIFSENAVSVFFFWEVNSEFLSTLWKIIFHCEASRVCVYVVPSCTEMKLSVRHLRHFLRKIWDISQKIIKKIETISWKNSKQFFRKFRVFTLFLGLVRGASRVKPFSCRWEVSAVGEAEQALLSPACSNTSGSGWDSEGFCTESVCEHTDSACSHQGCKHIKYSAHLPGMCVGFFRRGAGSLPLELRRSLGSPSCWNIDINVKWWWIDLWIQVLISMFGQEAQVMPRGRMTNIVTW